MDKSAAIYARVSSDQQKENHTIQSQTAALIKYARTHGCAVPPNWQFQDEGYSRATLLRPGLEAVRDLAAAGQIAAVLVYSPDRLSRKYAYQVLLAEEFARNGVELVFLQSPSTATAEDQLLVQFQGMIAEYERAQIAERSRRGKRHRAQQGSINVLCGAPYGHRYIKKTDTSAAYYQVIEAEADVVRTVFDWYTRTGMSIGAITRELNQRQIPTRSGNGRWERSTVWGILRDPAYCGRACFGKTERRERQHINRRARLRGGLSPRQSAVGDRPRQEWIEIPVPALVSEQTFALAQEQLQKNKQFASRRTIRPTLQQGLLVCQQCGYAFSGASGGRKPHGILYYYRCIGSDSWRHLHGPVCQNRPLRQDYIDDLIWQEVLRLLQDPTLIQNEIQRRVQEAEKADPLRLREQSLHREQAHLDNKIDRLLTAYQQELITLEQLRQRMPDLRQQQHAVGAELESLHMAAQDQSRYLRVVDSLNDFRTRLQGNAERFDLTGRRKIIRLLVKEILVGTDTITIRHSIPLVNSTPQPTNPTPPSAHPHRILISVIDCVRGVLSPLLSNLVLDQLDRELERRGHRFARYADDCNIYVRSRRAGQRPMGGLTRLLEGKLKLKVNREKSAVTRPWERKFLGFSFTNGRQPKRRIAPKAKSRFEARVRILTRRMRGISIETMVRELGRYLQGWQGYFGFCQTPTVLDRFNKWIRRRIRSAVCKQWRTGKTRYARLRELGLSQDLAARTAGHQWGPWRLSRTEALSYAMPAAYFDRLGLPSLRCTPGA